MLRNIKIFGFLLIFLNIAQAQDIKPPNCSILGPTITCGNSSLSPGSGPGGATNTLQYNAGSGLFGGISGYTTNGTTIITGNTLNLTGKEWINTNSVDTSNRAGALGISYLASAYVSGTDPGDNNRGISIVGVTAGRPSILNIRNTTDSFGWDLVADYAVGAGNLYFAAYNHGAYATKLTINDLGDGIFARSLRTGPGSPNSSNNNYMSVSGGIDNVLELQNFATDHYSAVRYMDSSGNEKSALGYANSASLAVFAGHSYWESFAGNNDIRIVMNANTGVTWRWTTTTGDVGMYADSGSSGTAFGTQVLSIQRSTGNLTSAGTITAGKTVTSFTDAVTNAVTEIQKLSHLSSGTVAANFGVGTGYYLENAAGTEVLAAQTEVYYNNATAASEGARWRVSLISSGSMNVGAFEVQRDGSVFAGANVTAGAASSFAWSGRGNLTSPATNSVQIGVADSNTPAAQTLRAQSASGTNISGANFTIIGSLSTGASGVPGDMIFQTGVTGSGTVTAGAATTALTIKGITQTVAISTSLMTGSATPLALTSGAIGMTKITASASAPGASGSKFEVVCGTNSGTAKFVMYAGTSGIAVTVVDNVGAGVTGC